MQKNVKTLPRSTSEIFAAPKDCNEGWNELIHLCSGGRLKSSKNADESSLMDLLDRWETYGWILSKCNSPKPILVYPVTDRRRTSKGMGSLRFIKTSWMPVKIWGKWRLTLENVYILSSTRKNIRNDGQLIYTEMLTQEIISCSYIPFK